jgi:hypothetical protein
MKPTPFPQANRVLTAPEGTTADECSDLHVFTDGRHCVSRWEPTEQERVAIAAGASIWLWVWSGQTQPPVALSVAEPWAVERKRIDLRNVGAEDIRRTLDGVAASEKGPLEFVISPDAYRHLALLKVGAGPGSTYWLTGDNDGWKYKGHLVTVEAP